MLEFTETIVINGQDCDYDPVSKTARIWCSNCSEPNDVEISFVDGEPAYDGFVCEKCGTWNAPGE